MTHIASFVFNGYQENTYVVYDDSGECILFDPGCYTDAERDALTGFIEEQELRPVRLINTHCHIDHIFGNAFIAEKYGLKLELHPEDRQLLQMAPEIGEAYGTPVEPSPEPGKFLQEGDTVTFGQSKLEVFHTPGHSPGSISLYCASDNFVVVGDVLFLGSIGRYDFPLSNYDDLMHSIREKLFTLPDETTVYPGHGPTTTIGYEKQTNPFVNG